MEIRTSDLEEFGVPCDSPTKNELNWDSFKDVEVLGTGSFGVIYRAKKKASKQSSTANDFTMCVIKTINTEAMTDLQKNQAFEEINVQGNCNSPYIVKYYDSFVDESNRLNIVMEYCDNGDLHSYLEKRKKHLSEVKIWRYFIQITHGLHHLHSQNMLHRDLKTLNIFLTKDFNIKIGDLGSATSQWDDNKADAVGTPYYFSPELCMGNSYTDKCDIWALGCILYELCSLERPFEGKDYDELKQNILKGEYEEIPKIYSPSLSSLVQRCLKLDPDERPTIDEIMKFDTFQRQSIVNHINSVAQNSNKSRSNVNSNKGSFYSSNSNSIK